MRLDKTRCIIYTDLECLIKKTDNCKYNPEKSSTTKIDEDIPCRIQCQLYGHLIV